MNGNESKNSPEKHEGQSHAHDVSGSSGAKMFWVSILNAAITAVEIIGGILSGSLALISDSIHNLGDTVSIILSYAAIRISSKRKDIKKTYGYKRAQIIAAFINASALIVISFFLVYEAIKRFGSPEKIDGTLMIAVAVIGLIANLLSVLILEKDSHNSMNVKSSYLHLLGDTVSSFGVVLGGIAIKVWDVVWVDPLITLLVAAYVMYEASKITMKSIDILMQSSADMDYDEIQKDIESIDEVKNIHHVHTWLADEKTIFFEAHVEVGENLKVCDTAAIYEKIERLLMEHYGISHVTIQIEGNSCSDKDLFQLK